MRTEDRLQPHFYHVFRNNISEPRFRGWATPSGKEVIQQLASSLLDGLREGDFDIREFLSRFKCAAGDVSGAQRSHVATKSTQRAS